MAGRGRGTRVPGPARLDARRRAGRRALPPRPRSRLLAPARSPEVKDGGSRNRTDTAVSVAALTLRPAAHSGVVLTLFPRREKAPRGRAVPDLLPKRGPNTVIRDVAASGTAAVRLQGRRSEASCGGGCAVRHAFSRHGPIPRYRSPVRTGRDRTVSGGPLAEAPAPPGRNARRRRARDAS